MKPLAPHHLQRSPSACVTWNRRHFLRGLGICLGLPVLESLLPNSATALASPGSERLATTETGAPLRSVFIFFPNGAIPSTWWPEQTGTEFALSRTLSPLESMRRHVQILGGLDHRLAEPGPDGAGDHARGNGTFLTGVRMKKSATDVRAGVSIDQVIARATGHLTRFPSLELTCDSVRSSGACDSGYACAYQYNISWSSPSTPMAPEGNPRKLFERLFGAGAHGERTRNYRQRQQEQRSILDFVHAEAKSMQRSLSAKDREKLDQYLTGVRAIESRIQKAETFQSIPDPLRDTPEGIPSSRSQYIDLMFDMMVLAFQTDSTRVATMLLGHDGDNRSMQEIGIPEGHHDLSHHFEDSTKIQKLTEIDTWYVQRFARFLKTLEETQDGDGKSLLHNSMILYGSGNADANRHTHTNLPILLAGHGGGTLHAGQHLKQSSLPASNLLLSMADRMGLKQMERFGDSTGKLQTL